MLIYILETDLSPQYLISHINFNKACIFQGLLMSPAYLGKNLKYTNKLTVRWVFPRPGLKLREVGNKCYVPPNLLQTLTKKKEKATWFSGQISQLLLQFMTGLAEESVHFSKSSSFSQKKMLFNNIQILLILSLKNKLGYKTVPFPATHFHSYVKTPLWCFFWKQHDSARSRAVTQRSRRLRRKLSNKGRMIRKVKCWWSVKLPKRARQ